MHILIRETYYLFFSQEADTHNNYIEFVTVKNIISDSFHLFFIYSVILTNIELFANNLIIYKWLLCFLISGFSNKSSKYWGKYLGTE